MAEHRWRKEWDEVIPGDAHQTFYLGESLKPMRHEFDTERLVEAIRELAVTAGDIAMFPELAN